MTLMLMPSTLTLLIILLLIVLWGGGGWYGRTPLGYGDRGYGVGWIVVVVLIILLVLYHPF